jgi:hypothetical protein
LQNWFIAVVMALGLSFQTVGCGGVYEVDASKAVAEARVALREELTTQREALDILIDRVADIAARGTTVTIDPMHLEALYQRLLADLREVEQRLREIDAERVPSPGPAASGVVLQWRVLEAA